MATGARILVVDDERSMRDMLSILLRRHGYEVETASSGSRAISVLGSGEKRFDLVITDLLMDRGGGLDVLSAVKSSEPDTEVILVTAFGTTESAVEAMKKGAYDYVAKPFNVDEFLIVVRQALERRTLIRENLDLKERVRGRYRFADIIGRSPAMRRIITLCRKIADTNAVVLLSGESGTGKEVVARAIHFGGARAGERFVAINCGALPEQLMESELFGHVRGAFTGASEDKEGLFAAAAGGTVFLDEIGELPAPLQVKLLRVLQDGAVRPVGASEEKRVDARVISATNRDLEALVESGGFRTDLFYRLNVIHVRIPPLRERREDIPPLVEALLERIAAETGRRASGVSAEAMRRLLEHPFPGNVRELANVLERACMLATGDRLEVADLALGTERPGAPSPAQTIELPEEGASLDLALADVERDLIRRALDRTGGVKTRAAEILGITLRSLRYRMEKLGLETDSDVK